MKFLHVIWLGAKDEVMNFWLRPGPRLGLWINVQTLIQTQPRQYTDFDESFVCVYEY